MLENIKYALRFVSQDGVREFIHFLLSRPVFYENFKELRNQSTYPSAYFSNLTVQREMQMNKWHHYFDIYGKQIEKILRNRGTNIKLLEIGVAKGGSIRFWEDVFGPSASITGIDIDPSCSALEFQRAKILIGSQTNRVFLNQVLIEMGGVDFIVDDGSHVNSDVIETFQFLFPKLNDGGVYLIEDVQTSYWPGIFRGGFKRRGTSVEYFKKIVDSVQGAFYQRNKNTSETSKDIESIEFYESVIIINKAKRYEPKIWSNA
jgi:hypothetical protein